MASFNRNSAMINMDGSEDLFFRYTMPRIVVKHEGKGKMKKSVLVNVREVCESIGRPADYLMTYLGQKLSARGVAEKELSLSYVTGHHNPEQVQQCILGFIQDAVMCRHCRNPETRANVEGSKKQQVFFLQCKSCGKRSDLDNTDRFVRYMMLHRADDAGYGHASQAPNAAGDTEVSEVSASIKKECPDCGHKTSKSICGKCGCTIGADRALMDTDKSDHTDKCTSKQQKSKCPVCFHKTSKATCSKCGADIEKACSSKKGNIDDTHQEFLNTVQSWMSSAESSGDEVSLDDFVARIKTDGFTNASPADQLGAVVYLLSSKVAKLPQLSAEKLQPVKIAKNAEKLVETWGDVVEGLVDSVGDPSTAMDVVMSKVQEGVTCSTPIAISGTHPECTVVGFLLALRELDCVADNLLEGCRRLDSQSEAMRSFVEFLKNNEDEDEDEDF